MQKLSNILKKNILRKLEYLIILKVKFWTE